MLIAHDWLLGWAGSERVLREIVCTLPQAEVVTAFADPQVLAEQLSDQISREVIGSRAEATGGDDEVGACQRFANGLFDVATRVGHGDSTRQAGDSHLLLSLSSALSVGSVRDILCRQPLAPAPSSPMGTAAAPGARQGRSQSRDALRCEFSIHSATNTSCLRALGTCDLSAG